jgi:hypothetical protein
VLVAFSEDIARAWRFYCHRVGEPFARSTSHFRDAVREILGARRDRDR